VKDEESRTRCAGALSRDKSLQLPRPTTDSDVAGTPSETAATCLPSRSAESLWMPHGTLSLGIVLYEMETVRTPHSKGPTAAIVHAANPHRTPTSAHVMEIARPRSLEAIISDP